MEAFHALKTAHYGQKVCVAIERGVVFFDPDSKNDVVHAEAMSYDEYLDVQIQSLGQYRSSFAICYLNIPLQFKGRIEKTTERHICFSRIFVSGMYPDGDMFEGKEDHVWMDKSGFESLHPGDCVSFGSDVYRYVKTGKGKRIDFGLRNPQEVQKIDGYDLPSDDDLLLQEIDQIICETCFLAEHCTKMDCMMSPAQKQAIQQQMFREVTRHSIEEQQEP